MDETATVAKLAEIIADVLDLEDLELGPQASAADVDEWDSISHVQIMVAVEETFGVRFRTGELATVENLGELARRIAAKL